MDRAVYEAMAAEEDKHWWFVGRRAVLADLIRRQAAPVGYVPAHVPDVREEIEQSLKQVETFSR